jgi:hypothetical protein
VKGVLSPVGEASVVKTSGSGRKSRRKNKRAKCASEGKSEVVSLPSEDVTLARDWPESTSERWDRLFASGTPFDSSSLYAGAYV